MMLQKVLWGNFLKNVPLDSVPETKIILTTITISPKHETKMCFNVCVHRDKMIFFNPMVLSMTVMGFDIEVKLYNS